MLAHNCQFKELQHDYWGTDAVHDDIKLLPDYPHVHLTSDMIIREGKQNSWGREVSGIKS